MTNAWNQSPDGPSREELMAFADGELGPARRDEVAAWLEHHPEDRAEVEEHHRLDGLWKRLAPPEPSPVAWASVLARIENARPFRPRVSDRRARLRPWAFAGLAAAAVAAVMVGRSLWTTGTADDEEPFPVALASEVVIVSMDAHDADSLVGHPPVMANMEFAGPSDVQLLEAAWHEGRQARILDEGAVSMIVASAADDD
jgi:anti-sigma factor RsiW